MKPQKIKNLFLRQSYQDAWEEYEKSLTRKYFIHWDYVILTASNEEQADAYQAQIDARLDAGRLPKETTYRVLPDPDGKRVGQRRSHLPCDEILKRTGRGRRLLPGQADSRDSLRRGLQAGTPVFGLRKIIFTSAAGSCRTDGVPPCL